MRTTTLIPGDGIGPEIIGAALRVIEAHGGNIGFEREEGRGSAFWVELLTA